MLQVNIRTNVAELQAAFRADRAMIDKAVQQGMRRSKQQVREVLQSEMARAFKVKNPKFLRSWRISSTEKPGSLVIWNLARWFEAHVTGGKISPRNGRALLIPINTRFGTRIGTKKFYNMIDWLRREKLTVILNGVLYVKPVMNQSRRGGVAAGTRVNKRFRAQFQGSRKRPSGFEINLNENGLTPIAILRTSVTLRPRFDMNRIARERVVPIILQNIEAYIQEQRLRLSARRAA